MLYAELYQMLDDDGSLDRSRRALRAFLLEQLAEYEREPTNGPEIAYSIAGLLGARSIMRLSEDNPYREVLQLAGDLELPPAHRDRQSTWERFAGLVRRLPEPKR